MSEPVDSVLVHFALATIPSGTDTSTVINECTYLADVMGLRLSRREVRPGLVRFCCGSLLHCKFATRITFGTAIL